MIVEEQVERRVAPRASTLRRVLPIAVVLVDLVLLYGALVAAYWVRYGLKIGPRIQQQLGFGSYEPIGLLLIAVTMPVLLAKGAYRTRLSTEAVDEFTTIFSGATISIAAIVVFMEMLHRYEYSRGLILYLWVLVIALLAVGRTLLRSFQSLCFRRGWGVRRLLVVGNTDVGKMVMQSVMQRRDLGYHLVGFVERREAGLLQNFGRFRALGTVDDIPELVKSESVDEIILALPASAHEEVAPVVRLCERRGVSLKLVPDLFEMSLARVQVDDIAGIPLLDVQERPLKHLALAVKRLIDIVASGAVLVLSVPVIAVLALLIRLESPGAPILVQERVGKGGRHFRCLKLRSMSSDAADLQPQLERLNEAGGLIFKMRSDPRVTRVGRFMRRLSLDELPQIWNVFRGDMSLVGPRPPLPSEVERYESWHRRRLEVKPGLTGIWQVSGRSDLPFDEMVMMDLYYVDNWSVTLDIKILIRTSIAVLRGKGAY